MQIIALELRDFRSYARAAARLDASLTVLHGPNGAGKSNLIEAICFACTGRSPRTRNDRELIRFGAAAARVELSLLDRAASAPAGGGGRGDGGEGGDRGGGEGGDGEGFPHTISVGFGRLGEDARIEKRLRFDGGPVQRMQDVPDRPLVAVFVPDRLALIGGPPSLRRAHLDSLLGALWPARAGLRAEYSQALAQRNALIARIRAGAASQSSLASWDAELAGRALALSAARAAAVAEVAEGFAERCVALGLAGAARLEYRPALRSGDPAEVAAELRSRIDADLLRGHTTHGPHRDELAILRDGRHLRAYGSQGERRLALLALLLAERAALARLRSAPPVMLLDDALSELDSGRRELLLADLAAAGGQAVIATTDWRETSGWPAVAGAPHLIAVRGDGVLE